MVIYIQNNKLRHRNQLNYDPKCKTLSYKISRRKYRRKLFVTSEFSDTTPKAQFIKKKKKKIEKLDFTKIKKFCIPKDTIDKKKAGNLEDIYKLYI